MKPTRYDVCFRPEADIGDGGLMDLAGYFNSDDGSLPEIDVRFENGSGVVAGFKYLFDQGARNIASGGTLIWSTASGESRAFRGPDDAEPVTTGLAHEFHVVLADVRLSGITIPDLGVFVAPNELTFDCRMGPQWETGQIHALLTLFKHLQALGGQVSATNWWGDEIDKVLAAALANISSK